MILEPWSVTKTFEEHVRHLKLHNTLRYRTMALNMIHPVDMRILVEAQLKLEGLL